MSEIKKLYREQYRAKRKKYMLYQKIGLGLLAVMLVIFSVIYFKTDKAAYVYYADDGNAIHYAHLTEKGKEYFGVDKLNGSHAYVSSLIENMSADFSYKLKFDTDRVKYTYNYSIETQIEVLDLTSNAPLYNPVVCTQVQSKTVKGEGSSFSIAEHVVIDFAAYNAQAAGFINDNGLKDTSSSLIVRMSVGVIGASESFAKDHSDVHVTELRVPLCKLAFKPTVSSTIPAGEKKILAISDSTRRFFGALAIVSLVAFLLDIAVFVFFVVHTRDNYTDYASKVAKIRKNYRSYIQTISEKFPTDGCTVLRLGDFTELLEIRDVVQKPILMFETADKTCTEFVISSDGLIYMYEIKVQQLEAPVPDASVTDDKSDAAREQSVPAAAESVEKAEAESTAAAEEPAEKATPEKEPTRKKKKG